MPYTKQTWVDGDAGGTPISAARLNAIETGIDTAHDTADAAETPAGAQAKVDAHVGDAAAAHAASAVSFAPAGSVAATDVQSAIEELDAEKAGLASPSFTGTPSASLGFDAPRFRGEGGDSGVWSVFHATVSESTSKSALSVKGISGHTADLIDVRSPTGTKILAVTAAGRLKFNALDGTSALGAYQGYVTVTIGSTAYKLPIYA